MADSYLANGTLSVFRSISSLPFIYIFMDIDICGSLPKFKTNDDFLFNRSPLHLQVVPLRASTSLQ